MSPRNWIGRRRAAPAEKGERGIAVRDSGCRQQPTTVTERLGTRNGTSGDPVGNNNNERGPLPSACDRILARTRLEMRRYRRRRLPSEPVLWPAVRSVDQQREGAGSPWRDCVSGPQPGGVLTTQRLCVRTAIPRPDRSEPRRDQPSRQGCIPRSEPPDPPAEKPSRAQCRGAPVRRQADIRSEPERQAGTGAPELELLAGKK
jgi:hypothetical protein